MGASHMTNNRILVGITGRAGSGKDTFARLLAEVSDQLVEIDHFAEPLRQGLQAMLGLSPEAFEPALKELPIPWLGVSPRRLMQTLGTEWGREMVAPDLWVTLAQRRRDHSHYDATIFADVRFESEADWIRDQGGTILRMVRPSPDRLDAHKSEDGIARHKDDVAIYNAGSLDDLRHVARHIALSLRLVPIGKATEAVLAKYGQSVDLKPVIEGVCGNG